MQKITDEPSCLVAATLVQAEMVAKVGAAIAAATGDAKGRVESLRDRYSEAQHRANVTEAYQYYLRVVATGLV